MGSPRRSIPPGLAILALVLALPGCEPRDPLERARYYQDETGDFVRSLELLRELVEQDPEDSEINFRYGMALILTEQPSLAKWPLLQAMEDPEWLVLAGLPLARSELQRGRADEAIEVLDRVLAHDPDAIDALLVRAHARVRSRRDYEGALADAERALELDPDNTEGLAFKTAALLGLERVEEAAELIDQLESFNRDDALGLHGAPHLCAAQATFRLEKGELEAAEERFETCLELFPHDPDVVSHSVGFFDRIGRRERSDEILRATLEALPHATTIRANLIDRMRAEGRKEEVRALLRDATELAAPEDASAGWFTLALFQLEEGDVASATASFERARALDPGSNPDILFGFADALVVAGRYEEALELAETIQVPAHRQLVRGRVALAQGQPAEALEWFTRANQIWPNNAVSRYYTAVAAEQLGQFERAVEDYRYSMRIDTTATDAYLRLARMQLASGAPEAALQSATFQVGSRPSEDEAALLTLEILARLGRRPSPSLLAYHATPERRGPAAAALARGLRAREGPERTIEFLLERGEIDLADPLHLDALSLLIELLIETGRAGEALGHVRKALERGPEVAAFHALHARALAASGAEPGAVRAAAERALALEAAQPGALLELARLERKGGDAGHAIELYARAGKADPEERSVALERAALLAEAGQRERAEEVLGALLREHPYDAEAILARAELRAADGAGAEELQALARQAARFGAGAEAEALLDRLGLEPAPARSTAPEARPDAPEAG